jgi:hypothetical protein
MWFGPEQLFSRLVVELLRVENFDLQKRRSFYWEMVRQFARLSTGAWARRMYEGKEHRPLTREDLAPYGVLPDGRRIRLPLPPEEPTSFTDEELVRGYARPEERPTHA